MWDGRAKRSQEERHASGSAMSLEGRLAQPSRSFRRHWEWTEVKVVKKYIWAMMMLNALIAAQKRRDAVMAMHQYTDSKSIRHR